MDAALVRGSSRLEAYSDAIFAIVATVMVRSICCVKILGWQDGDHDHSLLLLVLGVSGYRLALGLGQG